MAGANMALAFGAVVAGGVVIDYGRKSFTKAFTTSPVSSSATGSGRVFNIKGFPAGTNPLPGASFSRADQGIDGTGKTFLSPWAGKVVYSVANDPGWDGGGYVAVQSSADPSFVYYVAEGISPIVHVGESVAAGQQIASPVASPYNGIVGNFEAGRANPAAPGQPLAQVIGDSATMVKGWISWLQQVGIHLPSGFDWSAVGHA